MKLAFWIVSAIAAMAWLASVCAAGDKPGWSVYRFEAARPIQKIDPQSISPPTELREVVLLVPDFPCAACQYLEGELSRVPGIRVRKQIDMTRPNWPWISIPDTGRRWQYVNAGRSLTADIVRAILKAYPPVEKPAKEQVNLRAAGREPE